MVTYTDETFLLQGQLKSLSNGQIYGALSVQGQCIGYTSQPTVTITGVNGEGSGASATAYLKMVNADEEFALCTV